MYNVKMAKKFEPLLAIVGETATGKSALAMELAKQVDGEIICADSATVRQGINIGTAKPSAMEREEVPHHLLDIIGTGERFTVADFKRLAEKEIEDISKRGKLAIMAGGTGLYIDSVLYDYRFGTSEAIDRDKVRPGSLIIGLKVDRKELESRIEKRVDAMLANGLRDEVEGLVQEYGWDCLALKNVGYAQWRGYFEGQNSLTETRQLIVKATVGLAKRQRTWFKRNNSIQWFDTPVDLAKTVDTVTTFLSTQDSQTGQYLLH